MPEKLLILTFSFHPYSTVSALRMTRFAKYLPGYDIEPYIVTARQGRVLINDKAIAPEQNSLFPNTKQIKSLFSYRFESPLNPVGQAEEKNRSSHYLKKLIRLIKDVLLSPDKHILWSLSTLPTLYRTIKKHQIKTLLVTGDPFSLFVPAILIKKMTGIRLILDYRDLWLSNPVMQAQTTYRRNYAAKLQQQALQAADYIFTVNSEIWEELAVDPKKKECLPNGFDPEYFAEAGGNEEKDKIFRFFYAGKLDVNTTKYNPLFMLKCFQDFRKQGEIYSNCRLILCGPITKQTLKQIEAWSLRDNVEIEGEMPNSEVIKIGKKCDAAIHFSYPEAIETILPVKIYEYLMLKKPVISINSTEGLIADLLKAAKAGFACPNDDPDAAVALMKTAYHLDKDEFLSRFNEEPLKEYDVRYLTGKLANVIKQQAVSGTVR